MLYKPYRRARRRLSVAVVAESKAAILEVLKRGPLHGYGIYIQSEVSLGSVYRHLRELEKAGFIKGEGAGKRRVYRLTVRGRKLQEAIA